MPLDLFPDLSRVQSQEVLRLIGEIDEFKGRWRRLSEIRAEKLEALRQVATIESAGSSTRIEGAELSDAEVADVLNGLKIDSFRSRDTEEVQGYLDLLATIHDNHAGIPLDENHIRQLHAILLRPVEKDERHRGEYKKFPNDVTATHSDGRVETVFQTASPFDTPRLMAQLVAETNAALEDRQLHPLITIARFIVVFLAIHPFQDGNGRLSRVLTTLLLLRAGYEYVAYASLERRVEDNKVAYYGALRESQLAMRTNPHDFAPWLIFFLRLLQAQTRALESKLRVEQSLLRLSAIQERIVAFVREHGRATTPQISAALQIARRTVRYHLDLLVGRRALEAHGQRKGRYYTAAGAAANASVAPPTTDMPQTTAAVLAEILENGGRIRRRDLVALVKRYGFDPRTVGTLHGRRLAHLRRDEASGESVLTARGEEIARQHLFARRLAGKARDSTR